MPPKNYQQKDVAAFQKEWLEEKTCLIRIISTYAMIAESFPEYAEDIHRIKSLLQAKNSIPQVLIEEEISNLRRRIFAKEVSEGEKTLDVNAQIEPLTSQIMESLRMLRQVIYFFLEDFYPLERELAQKASDIHIEVRPDVPMELIREQVEAFSSYSLSLKQKIFSDLKSMNETFVDLLKQVQMVEQLAQDELSTDDRAKEFQCFEKTIGEEMGAITQAFKLKKNINDLRTAVMEKLGNIKKIVSQKKQTETQRLQKANKKISQLKKKIMDVQTDAKKIFAKAEEIEQTAFVDGLTQVQNRKSFDLRLHSSLETLSQGGRLALIMIDVNHFKSINDTFGHIAGDKVLSVIADNLKKNFRKSDFVARFGGDEFVVLVDGLEPENIQASIERFKTRLKGIKFVSHARKTNIKVEISAGLSMATPGDSSTELLSRADKAMYEDKKNATPPTFDKTEA